MIKTLGLPQMYISCPLDFNNDIKWIFQWLLFITPTSIAKAKSKTFEMVPVITCQNYIICSPYCHQPTHCYCDLACDGSTLSMRNNSEVNNTPANTVVKVFYIGY